MEAKNNNSYDYSQNNMLQNNIGKVRQHNYEDKKLAIQNIKSHIYNHILLTTNHFTLS